MRTKQYPSAGRHKEVMHPELHRFHACSPGDHTKSEAGQCLNAPLGEEQSEPAFVSCGMHFRPSGCTRSRHIKWNKIILYLSVMTLTLLYLAIHNTDSSFADVLTKITYTICREEPSEEQNLTKVIIEDQKNRLGHLKKVCQSLGITSDSVNKDVLSHLLVDRQHQLLYCYVPKVACTSWKRLLLRMSGPSKLKTDVENITRNEIHGGLLKSVASLHLPRKVQEEMLQKYVKVIFVRHPFERLVSAYLDKFLHEDKESSYDFHRKVGIEIERLVRGKVTGGGHNVTFSEFVKYVTGSQGALTEARRNEHWRPIFDICSPCSIEYDFLGYFENLLPETDAALHFIGLPELSGSLPKPDRPFNAREKGRSLYSSLDEMARTNILKMYLKDFIMYNYSMVWH